MINSGCFCPFSVIVFLTAVQLFLSLSIPCSLVVFWAPVHDERLEPIREERLLSTQANICSVLNWANMDKTNTISSSVCDFLPCCPFIPLPSLQDCCTNDHCLIRHMQRTRCFQASHWLRDKPDTVCMWMLVVCLFLQTFMVLLLPVHLLARYLCCCLFVKKQL